MSVAEFLSSVREFVEDSFGIANSDDTDHDEQSRNKASLAAAFDPPPPSRPTTADSSIDLTGTSPTRHQQQPAQRAQLPENKQSRRRPSDIRDERRLVGDYSTPADATKLPDPRIWKDIHSSIGTAMSKKPGAGSSFRPVDTLNGGNLGHKTPRPKTYSRFDRSQDGLIGHQRHAGQTLYMESRQGKSFASTHHHTSPQQDHDHGQHLEDTPRYKRRKTMHASGMHETIEITDDEDIMESLPSSAHQTQPHCAAVEVPRSRQSSWSQRSLGSAHPSTARESGSPPQSAFLTVEKVVDPRRKTKRSAKGSEVRNAHHSSQEPPAASPQSNSIVAHEDSDMDELGARAHILNNFQQGVSNVSQADMQISRFQSPETTSRHFPPKARINESTAEVEQKITGRRSQDHINSTNLRNKFWRVEDIPAAFKDHPIDSSEDELTKDTTKPSAWKSSVVKATQVANNGVRPRNTERTNKASRGWPLNFARTCDFEERGPNISLRNGSGEKSYRIVGKDAEGNLRTLHNGLDLCQINKLITDGNSRVRLEGPRRSDGNVFIFDLEFANPEHLANFSHTAQSECQYKYSKDQSHLAILFERPLARNDKVGQSPLVNEDTYTQPRQEQTGRQHQWPNSTLVGQLTQLSTAKPKAPPESANRTTQLSGRGSTHPVRSTRSSVPTYASKVGDDEQRDEVFKYSIEVGLGTAWHKSLSYGSGRQRSEVHQDDLTRLDNDTMLNDNLVDFYLSYLYDKYQVPSDKVYMWNTFFFPTLTQNTLRNQINYKAVERWTGRADMFSYDYIVVPVNENTHWYLAIICNVSKINRAPVIMDFDDSLPEPLQKPAESVVGGEAGDLPPLIDASRQASLAPEESVEPTDDDINLFDESSRLDLVDPEAAGLGHGLNTMVEEDKIAQFPSHVENAQAAPTATDSSVSLPVSASSATATIAKKKGKLKARPQRRDPDQPVIIILDSLNMSRTGTTRALKDWLREEGKTKRGMEAEIKEKGYYPKEPLIPTQNNFTDCGIYLLGYAEKFFRNPDEFKNKLLTGEMSTQTDWPDMKPTEMRNTMRQTLFELADQQKVRHKAAKRAKKAAERAKAVPAPEKLETSQVGAVESQSEKNIVEKAEISKVDTTEAQSPPKKMIVTNESAVVAPQTARLGSPIVLTVQAVDSTFRSPTSKEASIRKSTKSSPVSNSPNKRDSTTPRATATSKKVFSEVCMPVKTVQQDTVEGNDLLAETRISLDGDRPLSPSKMIQQEESHGKVSKSSVKVHLPAELPRRGQAPSSPAAPRRRVGSSMDPIEIEDSQEILPKLTANAISRHDIAGVLVKGRSPPKPHTKSLHHVPSMEEVISPSHTQKRKEKKHRQANNGIAGHEVEADVDLMEVDGPDVEQDGDVMQIDDMDDAQDTMVLETPERRRSSPPAVMEGLWQEGDSGRYVMRRE